MFENVWNIPRIFLNKMKNWYKFTIKLYVNIFKDCAKTIMYFVIL